MSPSSPFQNQAACSKSFDDGHSPIDYVQSLRMEEPKQMLEASDTAIDAVAEEVSYTEPAAFRRLFKRSTGISPLQYRQRFRQLVVVNM